MDIAALIAAQKTLLKSLNDVLDRERDILINDKCHELQEIIDAKKDISDKLSIIEAQRLKLCPGLKAEELVIKGLMTEDDLTELKELVVFAKEKSDINMALTRQSLNYIRSITSALDTRSRTITYGNTGKLEDGSARSLFSEKI